MFDRVEDPYLRLERLEMDFELICKELERSALLLKEQAHLVEQTTQNVKHIARAIVTIDQWLINIEKRLDEK